MIDIEHFQIAFACKWVKHLENETYSAWKQIPLYYYGKILPKLNVFMSNITFDEIRGFPKYFPSFYKMVIQTWLDNGCSNAISMEYNNSTHMLWNNKLLIHKGTILYLPRWIKAGILYLCDILDFTGNLDYIKLYSKVPNNAITQFELNCVVNAVQTFKGSEIDQTRDHPLLCFGESLRNISNKTIRNLKLKNMPENNKWKWNEFSEDYAPNILKYIWKLPSEITRETKLITLQ